MNFEEFVRKRESWIKQARKKDMEPKLTCEELVELEEALQFYVDKYGAVITCVTKNREHFVFTPSETVKLSEVLMPTEFLNEGE